jgi:23S rRNA (cytidine1920-2'-O)/16S rRNA (cytidine1409-2'-O)-methyltransferase
MGDKERLDRLLLERGLVESREQAQRAILAGEVRVGDRLARKPSESVARDAELRLQPRTPRFASRGGEKLDGALTGFGTEVDGRVCLDVGASTGGFTDCLLSRGAVRVHALDVGYGQLDWRLRQDPRVDVIERTNIRSFPVERLPARVDLATVDVSFISLELVLPRLAELVRSGGEIIALVKPQFEVGKGEVGKGGVVRDPEGHRAAVQRVRGVAAALGFVERGFVESPLRGPKGNREFFLWWEIP